MAGVEEDGLRFHALGWPHTVALVSEAEVVEAVTDAEHVAMLSRLAEHDGADPRFVMARRELKKHRGSV